MTRRRAIAGDWALGRLGAASGSGVTRRRRGEGGALIAIENVIDDARRENTFGLLMSLNMLIEFGDAFDYTGADFREWCSAAGFTRFESIALAGPASAAIAYKSSPLRV